MPRVSIVIPTRNRAALLARAVSSAQQAGSDLEVIVVDDASADETAKLCASLPAIKYVRLSSNQGLSAARNAGIAASLSDLTAFLDDDDLRLPLMLDEQVRQLDANPAAAFCYGRCLIADARRQLPTGEVYPNPCIQGDVFWTLLEHNFVPMPTVVARKSALVQHGLFDTQLNAVEDWDMWLRLSERNPVTAVDAPVAIYRRADSESGQMSQDSAGIFRSKLQVQARALQLPRARAASRSKRRLMRRRLLARAYSTMVHEATNAISDGNSQAAREKIQQAFGFRPFRTLASSHSWLLLPQR